MFIGCRISEAKNKTSSFPDRGMAVGKHENFKERNCVVNVGVNFIKLLKFTLNIKGWKV